MDEDFWNYLVGLRQELLTATTGIQNAGFSLYWDNTTSNSSTRRRLVAILERHIHDARKFGFLVVTRHTDCGRRGHNRSADQYGYITTNAYGLDIPYRDSSFEWGDFLYQGKRWDSCPCTKGGDIVEHHVIDDVVFERNAILANCKTIYHVLSDLQSAIDAAGDKQPRSGIREYLLRAIIQLNDAVLPSTVDEHIRAQVSAQQASTNAVS
ncbi:hypothetical protein [Devosia sp.]|uniref:hypothetical protein n=1 Tax=Devosia sp. TaxID=1871048 RepID=UPI003F7153AF